MEFCEHSIEEVLEFWFQTLTPEQWWSKDDALDRQVRERFSELNRKAAQCELYFWRKSAEGRLAEIIVLDQFGLPVATEQKTTLRL
jgi:uncharacterized protein (DUF924 family)